MTIRDGDWTLLKWDAKTGCSTWRRENGDGTFTIRSDQPVDEIVRENEFTRNATAGNRMGDFVKVASIPNKMFWDDKTGMREGFLNGDQKYMSKWLNDGDNRAFRSFESKC